MSKKSKATKKVEELLKLAEKDKKFLQDTKLKLIQSLNDIEMKLTKNHGAILVLLQVLEDK